MLKLLRTIVLIVVILGGLAWWLGGARNFKQILKGFRQGYTSQTDSSP